MHVGILRTASMMFFSELVSTVRFRGAAEGERFKIKVSCLGFTVEGLGLTILNPKP